MHNKPTMEMEKGLFELAKTEDRFSQIHLHKRRKEGVL